MYSVQSRGLWARMVSSAIPHFGHAPGNGLVLLPGPSGRYMKRAVTGDALLGWILAERGSVHSTDGLPIAGGPNCPVLSGADISPGQHEIVWRNPYRRNKCIPACSAFAADRTVIPQTGSRSIRHHALRKRNPWRAHSSPLRYRLGKWNEGRPSPGPRKQVTTQI